MAATAADCNYIPLRSQHQLWLPPDLRQMYENKNSAFRCKSIKTEELSACILDISSHPGLLESS